MWDRDDCPAARREHSSHLVHRSDRIVHEVKSLAAEDEPEAAVAKRQRNGSEDVGPPEMIVEVEPPDRAPWDQLEVGLRSTEQV
jgi:hypothetical protein